jgi:hypothetical protein
MGYGLNNWGFNKALLLLKQRQWSTYGTMQIA